MNTKLSAMTAMVALAGAIASGSAYARDQIRIVGSSTVFPYTQAVSEEFTKESKFPAPVVRSTGTGGGLKFSVRASAKLIQTSQARHALSKSPNTKIARKTA